ncbi:MAG: hypothetical protein IJW20_02960 [Clostridia bacterium]|nr:hypothetical protein [Clostridia bacterium]
MSKSIKICLILFLLLILSINFNFVQATSDEEITEPETLSEGAEENIEETNLEEETPESDVPTPSNPSTSTLDTLSTSSVTKVSNINSYEQANLQLNNILSIILIAIGVLLILFAIALLIRLSK